MSRYIAILISLLSFTLFVSLTHHPTHPPSDTPLTNDCLHTPSTITNDSHHTTSMSHNHNKKRPRDEDDEIMDLDDLLMNGFTQQDLIMNGFTQDLIMNLINVKNKLLLLGHHRKRK